jgi:hypothetical protein
VNVERDEHIRQAQMGCLDLRISQPSENWAIFAQYLAADDLDRDQAGREQAIMDVGQGKFVAHLRPVIVAQFQDFELADRVVDVPGSFVPR